MAKKPQSKKQDDHIHPFARKFLWLGDEKIIRGFIWVPIIGLIITVMAGFIFPHDPKHAAPWDIWRVGFTWDSFPSWALIGFCAYSFVVLSAEPLFRLLSRKENYYGEEEVPEVIIEPTAEVHHHD
ncbi:MAG: hypothetical protein HKN36_05680 [Hellea sp.]|nr:hypothetical protein [Hellea sp.]